MGRQASVLRDPSNGRFMPLIKKLRLEFPFCIKLMEHFELDITDNLVSDIAPITPTRTVLHRRQSPTDQEWWYVFGLQFLLWWSLWAVVDSIPERLGYRNLHPSSELKIYIGDAVLGGVIYSVALPLSLSEQSVKLKRFIGLVIMCCGAWGALDSSTELLDINYSIPSLVTYLAVLSVAGLLGAIHHYNYREGYLIDNLT